MNPKLFARRKHGIVSAIAVVVSISLLGVGAAGCNKLRARDQLNRGVQAYKNGQFDTAIEHFKQAKDLDPQLLNARLYLATAYASQYIPGAPSEENVRKGQQAIAEFQEVLQVDPNNLSAIDGIGSILFQMAATPFTPSKFEESKQYHLKHILIRPEDAEPYYWIGVIDWTLAFRANSDMRLDYNKENINKQVRDDQPLPPKIRGQYAAQYGKTIEDGIENLKRALGVRPDYDDAMAYLNLLYRRKADIVSTPEERDALLKQADELVDKVKEIKQQKMASPSKP